MRLFLLLALNLTIVFSYSQTTVAEKADEYLTALTEVKGFSGSVLIARHDTLLLKKGYGYANRELKVKNTPESVFLLASVTKQFTAAAIMILVNEGKIKLDGHISDYLSYYRKDIGEKITIHQLLVHTSGIPGYTEIPYFFANDSKMHYSTKEFVEKFCMKDLEFEPGTDQKYNNSAYYILGAIIEQVSGISYAEFIKENIFNKTGMFHSDYATNSKIIENRVSGYSGTRKDPVNAQYLDMSVPLSAGGLCSTVEDMYLWDRVLYSEFLLPAKWRDTMFHNYKNHFGYGWMIEKMLGHKVIHHNGGIHGFSTHISRFVDDDICIIILGNSDFVNASFVNQDLVRILFNTDYEIPRVKAVVEVDEKILNTYKGEYKSEEAEMIFTVTVENHKINIEVTGQPKIAFLAESETDFYLEEFPISITFVKNEKGEVTGIVLHQNGDHSLKKIK